MDDKRAFVHGLWAGVAPNWIERADFLEVRAAVVTKAIVDAARVVSTDRVLALADGTGGMALCLASSAGAVVTSDVVPALVESAQQRAADRGAANVTGAVIDIEDIDAPDAAFDVVVSREGFMFAVDPARCFAEVTRVLRPGGRVAAAVWGAPADNPWLAIVMDGVADAVGHPVPPPGMPGPFALSDAAQLRELAVEAGFLDVAVDRVAVPFHAPSFEQWWDQTTALAGPVASIVARFDDAATEALLESLRARLAPYATSDGFDLPGESLVVSGVKP